MTGKLTDVQVWDCSYDLVNPADIHFFCLVCQAPFQADQSTAHIHAEASIGPAWSDQ